MRSSFCKKISTTVLENIHGARQWLVTAHGYVGAVPGRGHAEGGGEGEQREQESEIHRVGPNFESNSRL